MAKSPETLDYERLATALFKRLEENAQRASTQHFESTPAWFDELLCALSPLKSLSPARGTLTKDQSAKLSDLHRALARTELSDAAPPKGAVDAAIA